MPWHYSNWMWSLLDSTFPYLVKVSTSNWFIPLPSPAMQLESACSVSTSPSFKQPQSHNRSTNFSLGCMSFPGVPGVYGLLGLTSIQLHFPEAAPPLPPTCCCYLGKLNERCKCQVHCDTMAIRDFRFDKPFILPKVLCMKSPFINMILLSLVLFGFVWNWTLQIVSMVERRTDGFQAQPLPRIEAYYFFSSLHTIYLATRMFLTRLSNYVPNCVFGISFKDVWQAAAVEDGSIASLPPARSLFVSTVKTHQYAPHPVTLCLLPSLWGQWEYYIPRDTGKAKLR